MPGNDTVLCAVDARGVASVTLNRPNVGNAYNGALIDGPSASPGRAGARLACAGRKSPSALTLVRPGTHGSNKGEAARPRPTCWTGSPAR